MRNKITLCLSISTPDFPHFYYLLGANLGSLLHGDFFRDGRIEDSLKQRPTITVFGDDRDVEMILDSANKLKGRGRGRE